MAQGGCFRFSTLHFGAKTCAFLIYFAHTRKKDLTFLAFALILAQEAPSEFHLATALAPARRNCNKIKGLARFLRVVFHVKPRAKKSPREAGRKLA